MIDLSISIQQLGIALGLGLLVGLQREHVASRLAGTCPMVTILGTVCAMLDQSLGGWPVAMDLTALDGIIIVGNIAKLKANASHTPH